MVFDDGYGPEWQAWTFDYGDDDTLKYSEKSEASLGGRQVIECGLGPDDGWGAGPADEEKKGDEGGFSTEGYTHLEFTIRPLRQRETPRIRIFLRRGIGDGSQYFPSPTGLPSIMAHGDWVTPSAPTKGWSTVRVPLARLGAENVRFTSVNIADGSHQGGQAFRLGRVALLREAVPTTNGGVTKTVGPGQTPDSGGRENPTQGGAPWTGLALFAGYAAVAVIAIWIVVRIAGSYGRSARGGGG